MRVTNSSGLLGDLLYTLRKLKKDLFAMIQQLGAHPSLASCQLKQNGFTCLEYLVNLWITRITVMMN